jgi:hypothetical protein
MKPGRPVWWGIVQAVLIGIVVGLALQVVLSILLGAEAVDPNSRGAGDLKDGRPRSAGKVVVVERPLAHEANAARVDAVEHEFRVVDRSQERA